MLFRVVPCVLLVAHLCTGYDRARFPGPYCQTRQPQQCCPGRDDSCTVPIRDSLCYCDIWCAEHSVEDCCPDFVDTCMREPEPDPLVQNNCKSSDGRITYKRGDSIKRSCNSCTCEETRTPTTVVLSWRCDAEVCINDASLIQAVNRNRAYGWTANSYGKFDGLSVRDGLKYFLGTINPKAEVVRLNPLNVKSDERFKLEFDSREKWPQGYIHPAMDQGRCAASWAFSTAGVAADRWSIQSKGKFLDQMSTQNMISCSRTAGCDGGRVEDAWWMMQLDGAVEEKCYPYTSGTTEVKGKCKYLEEIVCPNGDPGHAHMTTPPYRIANNEKEIMKEIETQGPVQAIIQVRPDFFLYERGVYGYTAKEKLTLAGTHSVKLIGWGEENGIKFWRAVNSWGPRWGEDGMFKIKRGSNESGVEDFVVGVWARVEKHEIQDHLRLLKHRQRHRH